jgi:hypothetical protein
MIFEPPRSLSRRFHYYAAAFGCPPFSTPLPFHFAADISITLRQPPFSIFSIFSFSFRCCRRKIFSPMTFSIFAIDAASFDYFAEPLLFSSIATLSSPPSPRPLATLSRDAFAAFATPTP